MIQWCVHSCDASCSGVSDLDLGAGTNSLLEGAKVDFHDGIGGEEYPVEQLSASTVASLRSVGGFQRGSLRIVVV